MEQHLQLIYNAIDRGVQRGIFNAKETYDVLTAYSHIAGAFITQPSPEPEKETTTEQTAE